MTKQLIDRLNNLKNRTDRDYEFAGESQKHYDKWQIDILEEIIPTIESQWIDVKERLPDNQSNVLITWLWLHTMWWYTWKTKCWYRVDTYWNSKSNDITHWMDLPNPPITK